MRTWLVISAVFIVLVALGVQTAISQWYTGQSLKATSETILGQSEDALIAEIADAHESIARELGQEIELKFQEIRRILFTLSLSPEIRRGETLVADDFIETILYHEPSLRSLSFVDSSGQEQIRVVRDRVIEPTEFRRFTSDPAYTTASAGLSYLSPLLVDAQTNHPFVKLAEPVERFPGEITGVLIAEIDLSEVWDLVALTKLSSESPGYLYVVDAHDGLLVAHPNRQRVLTGYDPFDLDLSQRLQGKAVSEMLAIGGEAFFVSSVHNPRLEWVVVAVEPAVYALAPVASQGGALLGDFDALKRTLLLLSLVVASLMFAGALVVSFIGARAVVAPIKELIVGTGIVATGNLEHRIEPRGYQEVNQLARDFNVMVETLDTSLEALQAENTERRNTEDELQNTLKELRESQRVQSQLAEENSIVAEIGRIFSSSLNFDEVFSDVGLHLKKLVDFARMNINLIYHFTGTSTIKHLYGVAPTDRDKRDVVPLLNSRIEEMLISGETLIVNDITLSPTEQESSLVEAGLFSLMAVPLVTSGEIIGALLVRSRQIEAYGSRERAIVEQLAHYIAPALQNAQLYEQAVQTEQQLIQAEKISALGTLVAGVAHELNNPMMGILNFAQYCSRHTSEDDKLFPVLQDIERETKRCTGIVENLLTFSRTEKPGEESLQEANWPSIFEQPLALLDFIIEREGVVVTQEINAETPEILVNVNQIQQVVLNLLSNALGGLKESGKANKEIRITTSPGGGSVQVTIADNGHGIDPDTLQRIFDPFFTTKPVGQGTGLGLSVSRSIIAAHGGEITCESEVGLGTRFRISLPIVRRATIHNGQQNEQEDDLGDR